MLEQCKQQAHDCRAWVRAHTKSAAAAAAAAATAAAAAAAAAAGLHKVR
jgi:hypothetical protein